jgi:hypothetical protein
VYAKQPKPSFLLNEKVYTKATTEVELTWLLHALESMYKLNAARMQDVEYVLGEILLHIALKAEWTLSKTLYEMLKRCVPAYPTLMQGVFAAATKWLRHVTPIPPT